MTGFRKHRQRGAAPHVCHHIDLAELRRSLARPQAPQAGGERLPAAARSDDVLRPVAPPEGTPHPSNGHVHANGHARVNGHGGASPESRRAQGPAGPGDEQRYVRQIDILERRVRKLAGLLEMREEELQRLLADPAEGGIASIYQRVQGVSEEGPRGELKRLLMSKIYEANLKLQERVSSLRQTAE